MGWIVYQPGVDVCGPGFDEVGEAEGEVPESDDGVGAHHVVGGLLKQGEEQRQVSLTELRTVNRTARISYTSFINC